jgi:hypothetical protein
VTPAVDRLEDRSLMALITLPPVLPNRNVAKGVGGFTVLLVSDEIPAKALLTQPQGVLKLTVTDSNGVSRTLNAPTGEAWVDVNRDGIRDLAARFRYRDLQGLAPGAATATVTDGGATEIGTWMIGAPPTRGAKKGR